LRQNADTLIAFGLRSTPWGWARWRDAVAASLSRTLARAADFMGISRLCGPDLEME